MTFSPYEHAAEMVELFGGDSSELREAARASRAVTGHLNTAYNSATGVWSGLPAVGGVRGFGVSRNAGLGSTRSRKDGPVRPRPSRGGAIPSLGGFSVPVAGQPSMVLHGNKTGAVMTTIRRKSRYADFITDAEFQGLERIAMKMMKLAQALSQGPLNRRELARRLHPYGHGLKVTRFPMKGKRRRGLGRLQGSRRGISNLAVVNRQSGQLAGSWKIQIARDKGGVTIALINTAPHAIYTAFGTIRMREHGPYTTAPTKFLGELNREWVRLARAAKAREAAIQQVESQRGVHIEGEDDV